MASPTYSTRGLVLKKTKLGETDLIITFLNERGERVQAVAKGARKPTSSFSARLELFSHVEMLCAKGKSLDIVKEVRLLDAHAAVRSDLLLSTAAAPMAESLLVVSQPELENHLLYDMGIVSFAALAHVGTSSGGSTGDAVAFGGDCGALDAVSSSRGVSSSSLAMCVAHLLKVLAFAGVRPQLDCCVGCGSEVKAWGSSYRFSVIEGGLTCPACAQGFESIYADARAIEWARYLLRARFGELDSVDLDPGSAFATLHLLQSLYQIHVGVRLKSLDFLLTCGLYE